jgi:glutathione peroxidase
MKIVRMLTFAVLGALVSAVAGVMGSSWAQAGRQPIDWSTVSLDSIGGGPLPAGDYKGRVVLLVNTASLCGFTGQYRGLEELWRKYKDKGLVVLGIPANDFGAQEPGSNKDIARFCEANFGVSFLMVEKLATPIPQNPFYGKLIKASGQAPAWNFHKYLIDRSGKVSSFKSGVEPMGRELTTAVESALAGK